MEQVLQEQLEGFYADDFELNLTEDQLETFSFQMEEY